MKINIELSTNKSYVKELFLLIVEYGIVKKITIESVVKHTNKKISEWEPSVRLLKSCENNGIVSSKDLARLSRQQFKSLPGITRKMVLEIEHLMKLNGVKFKKCSSFAGKR